MAKPSKPQAPTAPAAPASPQPAPETKVGKAFTVERVAGGWRLVTFTYELGTDKVVAVERGQPNLKTITLEQLKLANFNYWTKGVE